ncbi:MAG: Fe-only nitrogenase accessory AnfO family protein [Intestinibacillus sp.]
MIQPLIAVLTRDSIPCPAEASTAALLFARTEEGWTLTEEIPWHLHPDSASGVRDQVRSLVLELGGCRIVVAQQILGLTYHVFDRMGFQIFEADAVSDVLFDSILSDVDAAARGQSGEEDVTGPVPTDDAGRWHLDLIALQEKHPEISSKRALRDFLRQNRSLYELTLICSHLPPWLEGELSALRLGCRTEPLDGGRLRVTISRSLCKE